MKKSHSGPRTPKNQNKTSMYTMHSRADDLERGVYAEPFDPEPKFPGFFRSFITVVPPSKAYIPSA